MSAGLVPAMFNHSDNLRDASNMYVSQQFKLAQTPSRSTGTVNNSAPLCRNGFHVDGRQRFWRFFDKSNPTLYDAFAHGAHLKVVFQSKSGHCHRCVRGGSILRLDYNGIVKDLSWSCNFPNGEPRVPGTVTMDPHGHAFVVFCTIPAATLTRADQEHVQTVDIIINAVGEQPLIYSDAEYCSYLPGLAVKPLAGCTMVLPSVSSQLGLLEWVAYHKTQGMDQFLIYSDGDPAPLRETLGTYIAEGVVEVVDWSWPDHGYHHQQTQMYSCLYRYRGVARWVAFFDVDEYFQPLKADTLAEVLHGVSDGVAGLMALNVFFEPAPVPPQGSGAAAEGLITQRSFFRESAALPPEIRSKCIVRPEHVSAIGVHLILAGGPTVQADAVSVLRLNHYRNAWTLESRTEDNSMAKFGSAILTEMCRAIPFPLPPCQESNHSSLKM